MVKGSVWAVAIMAAGLFRCGSEFQSGTDALRVGGDASDEVAQGGDAGGSPEASLGDAGDAMGASEVVDGGDGGNAAGDDGGPSAEAETDAPVVTEAGSDGPPPPPCVPSQPNPNWPSICAEPGTRIAQWCGSYSSASAAKIAAMTWASSQPPGTTGCVAGSYPTPNPDLPAGQSCYTVAGVVLCEYVVTSCGGGC